jgi:hypothetical protein
MKCELSINEVASCGDVETTLLIRMDGCSELILTSKT